MVPSGSTVTSIRICEGSGRGARAVEASKECPRGAVTTDAVVAGVGDQQIARGRIGRECGGEAADVPRPGAGRGTRIRRVGHVGGRGGRGAGVANDLFGTGIRDVDVVRRLVDCDAVRRDEFARAEFPTKVGSAGPGSKTKILALPRSTTRMSPLPSSTATLPVSTPMVPAPNSLPFFRPGDAYAEVAPNNTTRTPTAASANPIRRG